METGGITFSNHRAITLLETMEQTFSAQKRKATGLKRNPHPLMKRECLSQRVASSSSPPCVVVTGGHSLRVAPTRSSDCNVEAPEAPINTTIGNASNTNHIVSSKPPVVDTVSLVSTNAHPALDERYVVHKESKRPRDLTQSIDETKTQKRVKTDSETEGEGNEVETAGKNMNTQSLPLGVGVLRTGETEGNIARADNTTMMNKLYDELLALIMTFLPGSDLFSFSSTSKYIHYVLLTNKVALDHVRRLAFTFRAINFTYPFHLQRLAFISDGVLCGACLNRVESPRAPFLSGEPPVACDKCTYGENVDRKRKHLLRESMAKKLWCLRDEDVEQIPHSTGLFFPVWMVRELSHLRHGGPEGLTVYREERMKERMRRQTEAKKKEERFKFLAKFLERYNVSLRSNSYTVRQYTKGYRSLESTVSLKLLGTLHAEIAAIRNIYWELEQGGSLLGESVNEDKINLRDTARARASQVVFNRAEKNLLNVPSMSKLIECVCMGRKEVPLDTFESFLGYFSDDRVYKINSGAIVRMCVDRAKKTVYLNTPLSRYLDEQREKTGDAADSDPVPHSIDTVAVAALSSVPDLYALAVNALAEYKTVIGQESEAASGQVVVS